MLPPSRIVQAVVIACTSLLLAYPSVSHAQSLAQEQPATPSPTEIPSANPGATASPTPGPAPSPSAAPSPSTPPPTLLPASVSLMVTGSPADTAFLQAQINAAIGRALRSVAGADAGIRYGTPIPSLVPLAPGFSTTYDVPVTVSGGSMNPVQGIVAVSVQNVNVPSAQPVLLALDDDPEYIRTDGVLFRGTIDAQRPTRVYYYHANVGTPRRFLVVLTGPADAVARVHVVEASAGPNRDVMTVGHAVSRSFVLLEPQNEGVVIDVQATPPFFQRDTPLAPGDGVAGAVDLSVLNGTAVTMTVMAIPPNADPSAYLGAQRVPTDGHNRHGTFALSDVERKIIAYTVGGPDATVEYGSRAQSPANVDPNDAGRDAGDYGVVHRFTFDVNNPLDMPATVYLYEEPIGGVVRNSFLINGTLTEVGCARLSQRYQVGSYQLGPRSSQTFDVTTMTDGGSNYPLEIGLTTTPPLPTTPPINAPDGCFPKASPSPQPSPSAAPPTSLPSPLPT
ncbi:MAG: hypothetical protein JO043_13575 [Candidatus Eremiobacteraeota bacterium]|nr:hypothetical protein [Candidatus Eremiobacteraeota bacterium]